MVTVVSGGLSGGISSTIAGGNFWDDFRQGIITSGLNHILLRISFTKKMHAYDDLSEADETILFSKQDINTSHQQ